MPPRITCLAPPDYREMPWRNGGGSTTEIAIEPTGAALGSATPFLWRLSMARVEGEGPFSIFPGYDRTLVLLEGRGVRLDFGPAAPPVTLSAPLMQADFSGDWPTHCQLLGGAVRDFNVMVDCQRVTAQVQTLTLAAYSTTDLPLPATTTLLFVYQGTLVLKLDRAASTYTVPAGHTLRLDLIGPGEEAAAQLCTDTEPVQVIVVSVALK